MKIKLLCCLLALLFAMPASAKAPKGKSGSSYSATIDNTTFIDANRILMFVTNHGNFGRDLSGVFGQSYGAWFPYSGSIKELEDNVNSALLKSPIFAAGIWVGGEVGGSKRVTVSEFDSEYGPGTMVNGTFSVDVPEFKVFKLYSDSLKANPNQDYIDYMLYGVAQGAPTVVDDAGDLVPDMIGDQMLWSVYNDADPGKHQNDAGLTAPLGVEIQQTFFAFNRQGSLGNMTFVRYRIYNKGGNNIDNMYVSLWCDPDLGNAGDDLVGSDTIRSLGYVYNDGITDNQYPNEAPPAMGFDFFQGPKVFTGDLADTALMWGYACPGEKNLPMSSFFKYINGTDPDNATQSYDYMRGLDGRNGGIPYVFNGDTNSFMHSGDPVAGTGDLDIAPNDRRFMLSTGPFTFADGDSTEIIAAIIFAQGGDNLNSITILKGLDGFAQKLYDGNIDTTIVDPNGCLKHNSFQPPNPPAPPNVTVTRLSGEVILTWDDTSEVDQGDYAFEGYTVWQGEASTGPWELLKTWDVDNGNVVGLIDSIVDPIASMLLPVVKRKVINSGLSYKYQTKMDEVNGGDLDDMTSYFFRVTAFSYPITDDSDTLFTDIAGEFVPVGDRFLESETKISVVPQAPLPGTHLNSSTETDIEVTHATGISKGSAIVQVTDPEKITGDDYVISFETDVNGLTFWILTNSTTGDTLLTDQFNQSGDDAYFTVEGLTVKVMGPDPSIESFQVVANASGPLDPPVAGAFDFQGFPTPGATNPPDEQQVGAGHWAFHTGDNGGSGDGGDRGSFEKFLERSMRNNNPINMGAFDYEMRFTAGGGYALGAFEAAPEPVYTVPFELWRTGVGTPNDPSDDVRIIPWMLDFAGDGIYSLESWGSSANGGGPGGFEHSGSGGDNDPFTDWVYWRLPADITPGDAGYQAFVGSLDLVNMVNSTYGFGGLEIIARSVLVNWNGGSAPPFDQALPETGTVFRLVTGKTNASSDTFTFSTAGFNPTFTSSEADLDKIITVPNPFYLNGAYDPSPGLYNLKFHNLPAECTISIYNLGGEFVKRIDKNDASTNEASWNLLTDNGLPVSSGIYIYVVDAPGFGQKIGKTAIFVEKEVLKIF